MLKIILAICFILGILVPRVAWYLAEGWKFSSSEPSETYLTVTRIASVIGLVVVWVY